LAYPDEHDRPCARCPTELVQDILVEVQERQERDTEHLVQLVQRGEDTGSLEPVPNKRRMGMADVDVMPYEAESRKQENDVEAVVGFEA